MWCNFFQTSNQTRAARSSDIEITDRLRDFSFLGWADRALTNNLAWCLRTNRSLHLMFTVWPIVNTFLAVYVGISELFLLNLQFGLLDILAIRDISFFMRRGGLKILWGGGHIFFRT